MRLDFCALCGEKDSAALEHHHFIPKVSGGSDDDTNMFTVCGTCHGKIHDIPRPLRLGGLVKHGLAKIAERSADDWRDISAAKAKQADNAEAKALELAEQEAKDAERALKRHVADARRRMRELAPKAPPPRRITPPTRTQMQRDKQFRVSGRWALASDGVQWVIQYRSEGAKHWQASKFIRSTKEHLAYRLKQMAPLEDAERLLEGLPDTFDEWAAANSKALHDVADGEGPHPAAQDLPAAMTAPPMRLAA
jgi:HNH endonuclease